MTPEKLTEDQIMAEFQKTPGWKLIFGGKLLRLLEVQDYPTAFGLLATVAIDAERLGHHPDMRCSYKMVEFILTTHDAGGLTALDFELARLINTRIDKVLS